MESLLFCTPSLLPHLPVLLLSVVLLQSGVTVSCDFQPVPSNGVSGAYQGNELFGLSASSLAGLALKTKRVYCIVRPDFRYHILSGKG